MRKTINIPDKEIEIQEKLKNHPNVSNYLLGLIKQDLQKQNVDEDKIEKKIHEVLESMGISPTDKKGK